MSLPYDNSFNGVNPDGMNPGSDGASGARSVNTSNVPSAPNATNMPVGSGNGDIVLTSSGNKTQKKWPIIVFMVVMIIVILFQIKKV